AGAARPAGRARQRRLEDGRRAARTGDARAGGDPLGGVGAPGLEDLGCGRGAREARAREGGAAGVMRRVVIVLLALLPGCTSCDTVPANALTNCQATAILPTSVQTDILFVVDDSGSMSQEQANLADNLGAFIDTLAASPVQNEFRIGVTNSSVDEFDGGTSYGSGPSKGDPYPAGALVAVKTDVNGNPIPGAFVYDTAQFASTGGWGGHRGLHKGPATLVSDFQAHVH